MIVRYTPYFLVICYAVCIPFISAEGIVHPHPQKVSFKEVTAGDMPLVLSWFKEPHVRQWWPAPEENELFENFLQRIRSKNTFPYMILVDGKSIGYIQYYYIDRSVQKAGEWLPPLPEATVGTDQFIGNPEYLGKGYGTVCIKEFITYLTHAVEPSITTFIVDPEPTNYAAIRCYEKVGFRQLGNYTTPFGPILLMRYDV